MQRKILDSSYMKEWDIIFNEIPEQLATDIMAYFNDETPPSGYVDKDKFIATDGATIEPAKASS